MKPAVSALIIGALLLTLTGGAWASDPESAQAVSAPADVPANPHHKHHSSGNLLQGMAGHCIGHAQNVLAWLSQEIGATGAQAEAKVQASAYGEPVRADHR
jgi:hypothetical protein